MELMIKYVVAFGLVLLLSLGQADARQIRINRYATEIENDSNGEVEARVTRLQPVPSTDFRSGRALNTSSSSQNSNSTESDVQTEKDALGTSTINALDWSTTTVGYNEGTTDGLATTLASNEVGKTPYPAAGYRPSRAFWLPTENQVTENNSKQGGADELSGQITTVSSNLDITTVAPDQFTTTVSSITTAVTELSDATTQAELAATNTESADAPVPSVTTSSPIASKTPYPPAGFRPSRAFLLPYEVPIQKNPDPTVVNHPVCGSSAFPLRPKPAPGAKEDPDAESVPESVPLAAFSPTAVVPAPDPIVISVDDRPVLEVRTQRLLAQPIIIARRQPVLQNWENLEVFD